MFVVAIGNKILEFNFSVVLFLMFHLSVPFRRLSVEKPELRIV